MASIRKEIRIDRPAGEVWDAIRDVGEAHTRLFPNVLTGVRLEGDARVVTFAGGLVVREQIVDLDDRAMRFAYSASGGTLTHHNASFQVVAEGDGSRAIWLVDLLPNDAAVRIDALMNAGMETMKATLERATPSASS
ncbi:MAG TPA: SRPBCC family protein [Candidatus Acidoferrales bacterium]|nr:SRPBCC family protein [Candidatus Acidoferrales bacterium]